MAFFAVAQAASVRNGGQSAADAAALGAASDDRDQLFDGFLDAVDNGDEWQEWLDATGDFEAGGCEEANYFAGRNESDVLGCELVTREGAPGYTVSIQTRFDTGDTVVPGASNKTAKASATAVVRPLCQFEEDSQEVEFSCDGEEFAIDPDSDEVDLRPADLFSLVLVD